MTIDVYRGRKTTMQQQQQQIQHYGLVSSNSTVPKIYFLINYFAPYIYGSSPLNYMAEGNNLLLKSIHCIKS